MTGPGNRILIVDDEAEILEVLAEHIEGLGYAVETVSNGPDALAAVLRHRPDLVLLDIKMPGMDGVEVLDRIRGLDSTIPIIVVTGSWDIAALAEALRTGACAHVPKPFNLQYFEHMLAAVLGGYKPPQPQPPPVRLSSGVA